MIFEKKVYLTCNIYTQPDYLCSVKIVNKHLFTPILKSQTSTIICKM